jgi:hypothetical protein
MYVSWLLGHRRASKGIEGIPEATNDVTDIKSRWLVDIISFLLIQ